MAKIWGGGKEPYIVIMPLGSEAWPKYVVRLDVAQSIAGGPKLKDFQSLDCNDGIHSRGTIVL